MRILHLVSSDERRGAEQFTADLAGALARRGVDQRVFVIRQGEPSGMEFPVPVVHVGPPGYGLPVLGIRARTARSLRRVVHGWAPEIVLAHGGETLKYAAISVGTTPLVYRRIGATPRWMAGDTRRRLWSALMSRASLIVAVADAAAAELVETFGVTSSKVVTIPNGVDPGRLVPKVPRDVIREALGVEPDVPLVLTVAALTDEKDPLAVLEVAKRSGTAVFAIAGDGPLRGDLEAAIERYGSSIDVRLLGQRSDVAELLAAADVFLLTSRTEGLPGALIEAGIAGAPRVATRVGGVPEVIVDGSTGLLARSGDIDQLAAHVGALIRDPALRAKLGIAGRADAEARFTIEAIAGRYLDVLSGIRESTWVAPRRERSGRRVA